jgi:hypothetical protein
MMVRSVMLGDAEQILKSLQGTVTTQKSVAARLANGL